MVLLIQIIGTEKFLKYFETTTNFICQINCDFINCSILYCFILQCLKWSWRNTKQIGSTIFYYN